MAEGRLKPVDALAAAVLLNGAAMNAALWVASSGDPAQVLPQALQAFEALASGVFK
ncbi:hypothetical protein [Escherichia coli]|uniref:hypothetical protein n=1 Tax=Escherichia coli TaxID=562 RepID=UPI0034D238EA